MRLPGPPSGARSRYVLAASRITRSYAALIRLAGGLFARLGLKVKSIEFRKPEILLDAWRDAVDGTARLILAFRHPYGDEPQLLSYAFDSALRKEARRLGYGFRGSFRARFVHGYEVPLWNGPVVRWVLPRSGAVPVYHVKVDRASIEAIRSILRDGPHPLALAPEGQISYRSEDVPRIEEGAARMGVWCAEDLIASGRKERVLLLPLSVHYRFDREGAKALDDLLSELEAECGIPERPRGQRPTPDAADPEWRRATAARIGELDLRLISAAEGYYGIRPRDGAARDERLDVLLEEALCRAEAVFGLDGAGDRINRVYKIRQEGWDRRYPEADLRSLPPLERRLADRRAGEAWYVMRHMELVDLCHYLDSRYLSPTADGAPPFDRLVEAAYSAGDFARRLVGGDITTRPSVLGKHAIISASTPIDARAVLESCDHDRKRASRETLTELERAFNQEIEEYIDGRNG